MVILQPLECSCGFACQSEAAFERHRKLRGIENSAKHQRVVPQELADKVHENVVQQCKAPGSGQAALQAAIESKSSKDLPTGHLWLICQELWQRVKDAEADAEEQRRLVKAAESKRADTANRAASAVAEISELKQCIAELSKEAMALSEVAPQPFNQVSLTAQMFTSQELRQRIKDVEEDAQKQKLLVDFAEIKRAAAENRAATAEAEVVQLKKYVVDLTNRLTAEIKQSQQPAKDAEAAAVSVAEAKVLELKESVADLSKAAVAQEAELANSQEQIKALSQEVMNLRNEASKSAKVWQENVELVASQSVLFAELESLRSEVNRNFSKKEAQDVARSSSGGDSQTQIDALSLEVKGLRDEASKVQADRQSAEQLCIKLQRANAEQLVELEKLRGELGKKEEELASSKNRMKEVEDNMRSPSTDSPTADSQAQVHALSLEVEALRDEASKAEADHHSTEQACANLRQDNAEQLVELGTLRSELRTKEEEIASNKKRIKESEEKVLSLVNDSSIADSQAQIHALRQEIAGLRDENSKSDADHQRAEQVCAKLRQDNAEQLIELGCLRSELGATEQKLASHPWRIEEAEDRVRTSFEDSNMAASQAEILALSMEVDDLRDEASKSEADYENADGQRILQIAKLHYDNAEQLIEIGSLQFNLRTQEQEVALNEEHLREAEDRVQSSVTEELTSLKKTVESSDADIQSLRRSEMQWMKQTQEAYGKFQQQLLIAIDSETSVGTEVGVEALQDHALFLEATCFRLEASESQADRVSAEKACAKLQQENVEQLVDLRRLQSELSTKEQELASNRVRIKEVEDKVRCLSESMSADSQAQIRTLSREVEYLREDASKSEADLQVNELVCAKLRQDDSERVVEVRSLLSELSEKEQELASAKERMRATEDRVRSSLKDSVMGDSEAQIHSLSLEVGSLRNDASKFEADRQSTEQICAKLRQYNAEQIIELASLRSEISTKDWELASNKARIAEAEDKVRASFKESLVAGCEAQIHALSQEVQGLRDEACKSEAARERAETARIMQIAKLHQENAEQLIDLGSLRSELSTKEQEVAATNARMKAAEDGVRSSFVNELSSMRKAIENSEEESERIKKAEMQYMIENEEAVRNVKKQLQLVIESESSVGTQKSESPPSPESAVTEALQKLIQCSA